MKYKGIELKEVTEPKLFNPPKKMLVWDHDYGCPSTANVCAIINRNNFRVITESAAWRHCAEIPTVTESELVTYRELAHWLAKGNGEVKNANTICPNWNYWDDQENCIVKNSIYVRKWDETEWHKPTREYIGLKDKLL